MQLNNGTCMQQLVKMLAVITNYLVITMQETLDRNSHAMRLVWCADVGWCAGGDTLLDLSAAFDWVDHNIVLHGLEVAFGLTNTALQWIRSFLTDHTQQVSYCGRLSPIQCVLFGVPQGSVLGPLLYVLYTVELELIVACHGLRRRLLYGMSQGNIRQVQSVQNATARLLTAARRREHISLPIQSRVNFKLACFVFLSLSGLASVVPLPFMNPNCMSSILICCRILCSKILSTTSSSPANISEINSNNVSPSLLACVCHTVCCLMLEKFKYILCVWADRDWLLSFVLVLIYWCVASSKNVTVCWQIKLSCFSSVTLLA